MAFHIPFKSFDRTELLQKAIGDILNPVDYQSSETGLDEQICILLNMALVENFEKHYLSLPTIQAKLAYYQDRIEYKNSALKIDRKFADLPMMKGVASGVAYEVDLFEFTVSITKPTQALISIAKKSLKLELVELLVNIHGLSVKEAKIKAESFLELAYQLNWVGCKQHST